MFSRALVSCSRCRCNSKALYFGTARYTTSSNPNDGIIEMLKSERERERARSTPSRYKLNSYSFAMRKLAEIHHPIRNSEDLRSIDGIGSGITKRVMKYLASSSPQNSALANEAERIRVVEELKTLPKVGKVRAEKLYDAGCRGIEDIMKEKYFSMLTPTQQALIRHSESLSQSAQKEELDILASFVRQCLPSEWEVIPTGAIRRGASSDDSGIHLLIVHPESGHIPSPPKRHPVLEEGGISKQMNDIPENRIPKRTMPLHKTVLPMLQDQGILVEQVSAKLSEWNGVLRIPRQLSGGDWESLRDRKAGIKDQAGEFRKARLITAPLKSRGATLLAETGDQQMWKMMCGRAESFGMLLTPSGLWKWREDSKDPKIKALTGFWELLQSSTEEEIFEQVDLDWIEPTRRNMNNVLEEWTMAYPVRSNRTPQSLIPIVPPTSTLTMAHLTRPEVYKIEDSNIALLGSDLEQRVREHAGDTEAAWKDAGVEPGLKIWHVEKFNIVDWPEDRYGSFYDGDSYILLQTYRKDPHDEALSYNLHFWLGQNTTQDEAGTAAYKTVELDDHLHGRPVQYREVQGSESTRFLSYFPRFVCLRGGVSTGFHHVTEAPPLDIQRLYRVASVSTGGTGSEVLQFNTKDSLGKEKFKAAEFVQSLVEGRQGQCQVTVYDEGSPGAGVFLAKFGEGVTTVAPKPQAPAEHEPHLFRISDDSGAPSIEPASPVSRHSLSSSDAFLLDDARDPKKAAVYVWLGRGASLKERRLVLQYAQTYLRSKHDTVAGLSVPIVRMNEGGEAEDFWQALGE